MDYQSIDDVRQDIDRLDTQLVRLLAERQRCVQAAAGFKTDPRINSCSGTGRCGY